MAWPSPQFLAAERQTAHVSVNLFHIHPRHYSVKTTPAFMELKAQLTEEIRVEVQRAAGLVAGTV